MGSPQSPDEWLVLTEQHRAAAALLVNDAKACSQAIFHAGVGVEAALKAYIMRNERLNRWPSISERKELWTHDLEKLRVVAGLVIAPTELYAPSWHIISSWERRQGYDPKPTPIRVASQFVEAAFGVNGIVEWLR